MARATGNPPPLTSAERSRLHRQRNPAIGAHVVVPDECRPRVCGECAEAERQRGVRNRRKLTGGDYVPPHMQPGPWLQLILGPFGILQPCRRHGG